MKAVILPMLVLCGAIAACGPGSVNPPDEPAQPIQTPEAMTPAPNASGESPFAGGPKSFVGRWAANLDWCERPQGEHRPIIITPMRFEGHENSCDIAAIDEVNGGYDARLVCRSEGVDRSERIRMAVSGDVLNVIYLDRQDGSVKLARCPNSPDPADEKIDLGAMLEK